MSENNGNSDTYQVTYQPKNRVWTLRKVPKHVFLHFGQLPSMLTEKAIAAMQAHDEITLGEELAKTSSPDELAQTATALREIIKYACVKPKISFTPGKDTISPLEVDDEEFAFLMNFVRGGGGEAERLGSFRGEPGQTLGSRARGKQRTKKR